jgi:hypothetical protein
MDEKLLYSQGKTIYEIAEIIGISPTGVWKRLKKQGVEMRGGTRKGDHWSVDKRGVEYLGADGRYWVRGTGENGHKCKRREVIVMEQVLGHPIPEGYIVHHKDEDPTNDSPDNLELMTRSQHNKYHHFGKKNPKKNIWK